MKSERLRFVVLTALIFAFALDQHAVVFGLDGPLVPEDAQALTELDGHFTFLIASDLGRNGYYDQKQVAEMMGEVAAIAEPEFIAMVGDVHHFQGVRSVQDPLWLTNFEWIYKHPELMISWHPVLGNHEYEGSSQAVIDYSTVSRRWEMPDRYYSMTESVAEGVDILLLFIDTTQLIDKYRDNPVQHPDAGIQAMDRQLAWIDATLGASQARWKIVLGHHPIYAGTTKAESERTDLQERLQPLLDSHGVDIMVSGHIHNFQHNRVPESGVDYFVNSSASQSRVVIPFEGALFANPDPGFTLCTVAEEELIITFVDKNGKIIYQHSRVK